MIGILKNNLARLASRKAATGIALLLTAASMLLAVYFTPRQAPQARVALVMTRQTALPSSPYLKCTRVASVPPKADLLLNKYDAFVVDRGNGRYAIVTFKNSAFKQMLLAALRHELLPAASGQARRGVATNIIGCMTMFILLQGILLMDLYAEDKEQKQIERIAASPVSFFNYLLAHCLFTFSCLFMPIYFILMVVKLLLNWQIGFSLPQYLLPLAVICALTTAFTLLVNSLAAKGDTANMTGSVIVVLSSLLAGCFYPITQGSRIVQTAVGLLPQKALLSFVQGWENGVLLPRILPQLSYVVTLTLLMFGFSVAKNLRDYVRRGD